MTTLILVPTFLVLFLLVRGLPVVLYSNDLAPQERLPFALASAVASLSIVVVVTEIGVHTRTMHSDIAAALVGASTAVGDVVSDDRRGTVESQDRATTGSGDAMSDPGDVATDSLPVGRCVTCRHPRDRASGDTSHNGGARRTGKQSRCIKMKRLR